MPSSILQAYTLLQLTLYAIGLLGYAPEPGRAEGPGQTPESHRTLWRLIYLDEVVAGCGLFLVFLIGVGTPDGFVLGGGCPYRWTHSAVASAGGVDVLPGVLPKG